MSLRRRGLRDLRAAQRRTMILVLFLGLMALLIAGRWDHLNIFDVGAVGRSYNKADMAGKHVIDESQPIKKSVYRYMFTDPLFHMFCKNILYKSYDAN